MTFLPIPNVAKVVINQSMHNTAIQTRLYVRNNAGWSGEELNTLNNLLITWWNDDLAPNLTQDMTLGNVDSRDMTVENGARRVTQAPPGSAGDRLSAGVPGNIALAMKLSTGLAGRAAQGRIFQAGFVAADLTDNNIADLQRDALVSAYQALRGALEAADYQWVIVSLYKGTTLVPGKRIPTPRTTPLVNQITDVSADVLIDSQRRRLGNRGI